MEFHILPDSVNDSLYSDCHEANGAVVYKQIRPRGDDGRVGALNPNHPWTIRIAYNASHAPTLDSLSASVLYYNGDVPFKIALDAAEPNGIRKLYLPALRILRVDPVPGSHDPQLADVQIDRNQLDVSANHRGFPFRLVLCSSVWTSLSDPFFVRSKQPETDEDAARQHKKLKYDPHKDKILKPAIHDTLIKSCKDHIASLDQQQSTAAAAPVQTEQGEPGPMALAAGHPAAESEAQAVGASKPAVYSMHRPAASRGEMVAPALPLLPDESDLWVRGGGGGGGGEERLEEHPGRMGLQIPSIPFHSAVSRGQSVDTIGTVTGTTIVAGTTTVTRAGLHSSFSPPVRGTLPSGGAAPDWGTSDGMDDLEVDGLAESLCGMMSEDGRSEGGSSLGLGGHSPPVLGMPDDELPFNDLFFEPLRQGAGSAGAMSNGTFRLSPLSFASGDSAMLDLEEHHPMGAPFDDYDV